MPEIYLLIEGQQHGPYSEDQVRQSIVENSISVDLPAWHEGMTEWVPVQSLLERSIVTPTSVPPVTQGRPKWDFKLIALGLGSLAVLTIFGLAAGFAIILGSSVKTIALPTPSTQAPPPSQVSTAIVRTAVVQPRSGTPWENSLGMKFVSAGTSGILFGVWDVRVKDYQVFVNDTGNDWPKSKFSQTEDEPAVKVSWNDAKAFCDWLTKKDQAEGRLAYSQHYRLPTDVEWSTAVGLQESEEGTPHDKDGKIEGVYPWGTQWPPPSKAGNYDGEDFDPQGGIKGYRDGYPNTSPVGSFPANQYGLYDMGGNVWQWCEDQYDNESPLRSTRGGSWDVDDNVGPLSSCRRVGMPGARMDEVGFRVVVVTGP